MSDEGLRDNRKAGQDRRVRKMGLDPDCRVRLCRVRGLTCPRCGRAVHREPMVPREAPVPPVDHGI